MGLVKRLYKSEFLRNVTTILFGSASAQAITFFATPILSRLYSTEAFGVFGVFMAIVGVLATLATGRYNIGIMIPKSNQEAQALIKLCLFITCLFGITLFLILLPNTELLAQLFKSPGLEQAVFLIPAAVFLLGLQQVTEFWSSREKSFRLVALSIFAGAVIGACWRIVVGYHYELEDSQASALIFGSILSFLVSVLVLGYDKIFRIKAVLRVNHRKVVTVAKKYTQLPAFRAPKDFVNSISQNLPALMLASFFGAQVVGLYVIAERLMKLPSKFVGSAITKVLYQKITAVHHNKGSVFSAAIQMTIGMSLLAVAPFAAVAVWGEELFSWFLGAQWGEAGLMASWLSLGLFFGFVNVPSVIAVPLFQLEKLFLGYELVSLVARVSALLFGGVVLESAIAAIAAYSIISAVLNFALIVMVLLTIKKRERATLS